METPTLAGEPDMPIYRMINHIANLPLVEITVVLQLKKGAMRSARRLAAFARGHSAISADIS